MPRTIAPLAFREVTSAPRHYDCVANNSDLLASLVDAFVDRIVARLGTVQRPASEGSEWLRLRATPEPRAVRRAVKAGQLPAYRIGRALLIRRSDLDAWILSRPHEPAHGRPGGHAATDPLSSMVASGRLRRIG